MTFDIIKAKEVANSYSNLVGQPMGKTQTNILITHVAIMPHDRTNITKFLIEFYNSGNNEKALSASGYDNGEVEIYVLSKQQSSPAFIKKELDKYLSGMGIEKTYTINK